MGRVLDETLQALSPLTRTVVFARMLFIRAKTTVGARRAQELRLH